ncbi:Ribulose-phosphate 3-epimerase [Buchnera aphidicola (Tetraneura ulmi)]|uniref:ribulose-phosphate 3-epimerase n=1 Tax=Buchnera aphidicola TaxID=9 RepID=UPI0034645D6C
MKNYFLAPSILSADFIRLGEEINESLSSGGDVIHFDVMDGHYVENLTFGPAILKSIRNFKMDVPIDVHLMTYPVDKFIPMFADAGATFITFHPEATNHLDHTINLIKSYGCKVGLSFNPTTSLDYLDYTLDRLDIIVLMSVNPGFGGQNFIPFVLKKLSFVRNLIEKNKLNILLAVDGGVKVENIGKIARYGADFFVIGTSLFGSKNYKLAISLMRKELEKVSIIRKKI